MTKTPMRSLRIPDDPWEPAKDRAHREGTTIAAVVLRALTRYAKHNRTTQAPNPEEEL